MNCAETLSTPDLSHLTHKDFEYIYEPAEDSFLFLDALEKDMHLIRSLKPTLCLEIGCGSGIISTCVSKALGSSCFMMASDVNPIACKVTRETSARNRTHVEALQMDLDSMLQQTHMIDLLLFNPPYVVTPSEEIVQPFMSSGSLLHRAWAGGKQGREVTDRLLCHVSNLLSHKSLFYLVAIRENNPDDIASTMTNQGFAVEIVTNRKVRGEHLLIMRFSRGISSVS